MQFFRVSFSPIAQILFVNTPHWWKWASLLKNTVAKDGICCWISRHCFLRVHRFQWVGASLTFCKDAFLNPISELFVCFDPKYWEPALVSLLNAWEIIALYLIVSLLQWFLEFLSSAAGHLFSSCGLIQYSWSLKPIPRLNYAEAQGLSIENWNAIGKLVAWTWSILFRGMS